jgi:hypothetical protein
VGINQCVCFANFEGDSCEFKKGKDDHYVFSFTYTEYLLSTDNEDSLNVTLQLKEYNASLSQVEVDLQSLVKSVLHSTQVKVVTRARSLNNNTDNLMAFSISLKDSNDKFIEGVQLKNFATSIQAGAYATSSFVVKQVEYRESAKLYIRSDTTGGMFLYALDAIAISITCTFGLSIFILRNQSAIKYISPPSSLLMVFGVFCVQVGVLFSVGLPTPSSCTSQKFFVDMGFALFFGYITCYS